MEQLIAMAKMAVMVEMVEENPMTVVMIAAAVVTVNAVCFALNQFLMLPEALEEVQVAARAAVFYSFQTAKCL